VHAGLGQEAAADARRAICSAIFITAAKGGRLDHLSFTGPKPGQVDVFPLGRWYQVLCLAAERRCPAPDFGSCPADWPLKKHC